MSGLAQTATDAPMPDPKGTKSAMLPHKPADWPRVFFGASRLRRSRGSRSAVRPNAKFVAGSGETIVGRDQIRDVLARMIRSKTKLQSRVIKAISADDVTVLYSDFEDTTMDASEKTIDVRYNAVEVLRRQPNGCWKLIVGDPNRRE